MLCLSTMQVGKPWTLLLYASIAGRVQSMMPLA
jgi:hypothetical protein